MLNIFAMSFLAPNLKWLRAQQGITQTQLAEALKLNRPVIGAYEEQRAEPKISVLNDMAEYFGISVNDLVNLDLSKKKKSKSAAPETGLRVLSVVVDGSSDKERVALVPAKAAAGYLNGYGDPEFVETLKTFDLPFNELQRDRTYRMFQIKGDSMLPIPDGAYIIGSYLENFNGVRPGECYIFVTDNDGIVYKRLGKNGKNTSSFLLNSDNTEYDPFEVAVADIKEVWNAHGFVSFELP
jgi:transcriptional regulator with XRE-family HTH domain